MATPPCEHLLTMSNRIRGSASRWTTKVIAFGDLDATGRGADRPCESGPRTPHVRTVAVSRSTTPRPDGELSDVALVRLVAEGDPRALEQLYDRYSRPAYSLARRITGEGVFAEEVVQDVFFALWRDPAK